MGEALLIKSNAYKINTPLDDVDIMAGYCAILAIVRDSGGNLIPNIPVNCYDNGVWYNNTTNTLGMALFYTNSGNARLSTTNVCSIEGYTMADQIVPSPITIQRENGTKVMANFNFTRYENGYIIGYTSSTGALRFMDTHNVYVQMVGGGGGSSHLYGGGGGAYNEANVQINRSQHYNVKVGSGGRGTSYSHGNGGAGGTTSAFGVSAVGGGGSNRYGSPGIGGGRGSWRGGDGGDNGSNGNPSMYANANFNFGGGGAGGGVCTDGTTGNPIVNINYGGTWYNGLSCTYPDGTAIRNIVVQNIRYGMTGGGNSAYTISTYGPQAAAARRNIMFTVPGLGYISLNNADTNNWNTRVGRLYRRVSGQDGSYGSGGAGGGTLNGSSRYSNLVFETWGGDGGDGFCWVTIID